VLYHEDQKNFLLKLYFKKLVNITNEGLETFGFCANQNGHFIDLMLQGKLT
jgi:hypothetical protein